MAVTRTLWGVSNPSYPIFEKVRGRCLLLGRVCRRPKCHGAVGGCGRIVTGPAGRSCLLRSGEHSGTHSALARHTVLEKAIGMQMAQAQTVFTTRRVQLLSREECAAVQTKRNR